MSPLAYKPNALKTMFAAYRGKCRVGYVTCSPSTRPNSANWERPWCWELNLLKPEGGRPVGRAPTMEAAQKDLEDSFQAWCKSALLTVKKDTKK